MNVTTYSGIVDGKVTIEFPNGFDKSQGGTVNVSISGDEGFTLGAETVNYTASDENIQVPVTFDETKEVGTYDATITAVLGNGENETIVIPVSATIAAETQTDPTPDPTPDPDPETGEEEETEEEEVNDFFSRKDVTGEVIRVFEEDYWPVDFVNVEPDKFAIMPGEGVELDCMFGDASIPAAETTTEPEGTGN